MICHDFQNVLFQRSTQNQTISNRNHHVVIESLNSCPHVVALGGEMLDSPFRHSEPPRGFCWSLPIPSTSMPTYGGRFEEVDGGPLRMVDSQELKGGIVRTQSMSK